MKKTMLLRQINSDVGKSSCYDIDDIARRFGNMEPGFARKLIDFANEPSRVFLRKELRDDERFKYYWEDLRNDSCRL